MALEQDPCIPTFELQSRNYIIYCFAFSLVHGETIQARIVRHSTIRNYVTAAVQLHTERTMPYTYKAPIDYISLVLNALKNTSSNQIDVK